MIYEAVYRTAPAIPGLLKISHLMFPPFYHASWPHPTSHCWVLLKYTMMFKFQTFFCWSNLVQMIKLLNNHDLAPPSYKAKSTWELSRAKSIWSRFHLSLIAIFSFYPSSQIDANSKQGFFYWCDFFLMKKLI